MVGIDVNRPELAAAFDGGLPAAIALGSTELSRTAVIPSVDTDRVVQALHALLFCDRLVASP